MLVEALTKWQKDWCISDKDLGELLGCDRSLISHIRHGRRAPSKHFIEMVIRRIPELMPECLIYMRDNEEISLVEV